MKYCTYCGHEIHDEAVVCVGCGRSVTPQTPPNTAVKNEESTLSIVVKVFLILGCISQGWLLIPLAWCLPLTISVFNSLRDKKPISTGMKICVLIFVNLIAGICLLCMDDEV